MPRLGKRICKALKEQSETNRPPANKMTVAAKQRLQANTQNLTALDRYALLACSGILTKQAADFFWVVHLLPLSVRQWAVSHRPREWALTGIILISARFSLHLISTKTGGCSTFYFLWTRYG